MQEGAFMYIHEKYFCDHCLKEIDPEQPCPYCGFDIDDYEEASHTLPHGTLLKQKYVIGSVIGEGGFGITYAGWDLALNKPIAIKEFYPQNKVSRNSEESFDVTPDGTEENQLVYYNGVEWFQREARILAALGDTHNVVHVEDFFQANGTAYIIMDFIRGKTLADYVAERGGKIPEAEVLELLKKPIEALGKVHQFGLLHGDISPSNLMLDDNREVHLIDFGASSSMKDDSEFNMQVLFLNQKFASPEQLKNQELGTWSDVYAVCATIIYLMTGKTIPSPVEREANDPLPSILRTLKLTYRQKRALRHGLMLNAKRRTENIALLLYELYKVPLPKSEEELKRQKRITLCVAAVILSLYTGTVLFLGLDIDEKIEILYRAYILKDTAAVMEYAKKSAYGIYTLTPQRTAEHWFQWLVDNGTEEQLWDIAQIYYENSYKDFPEDKQTAIMYFARCASYGNSEAMNSLGVEYATGNYIEKDLQKAKELFEAASDLGNTEALVNLGILEECELCRPEKAFTLYMRAAELGNAKGMRKVAYAYCDGTGVVQNWDEATRWMMMASSAGDPEAMGEIGGYYLYNTFISPDGLEMRDAGTGMLLLDQAIWNGSASARYYWSGVFSGKYDITGSAYAEIMDIPSEEHAFSQMRMSAEMGYRRAMGEVADMYEQGIGTMIDLEQAAYWRDHANE